jgi:ribosome maturation factor RimP
MTRPGEVLGAFEAWRAAQRALSEAPSGTADWFRLRLVEQDLRMAYERLNTEHARAVYDVTAEPHGPYWLMRVRGGPEVMTKATRLDDAEEAVREVIAVVDDIERDAFEIDLDVTSEGAAT